MMYHKPGLDALMTAIFGNPGLPWCVLKGVESIAYHSSRLRCWGLKGGEEARPHSYTRLGGRQPRAQAVASRAVGFKFFQVDLCKWLLCL